MRIRKRLYVCIIEDRRILIPLHINNSSDINMKRAFVNRIEIPVIELREMKRLYEYSYRSWKPISDKYGYSENVIRARMREFIGNHEYNRLKNLSKKGFRPIISLRDEDTIQDFPLDARNIILARIFSLLYDDASLYSEMIIDSIITDLFNGAYWTKEISLPQLFTIKTKIEDQKYFAPIFNFFKDLILISNAILEYLKSGSMINISHIVDKTIARGLKSYTEKSLFKIITEMVDFLNQRYLNIDLDRYLLGEHSQTQVVYSYSDCQRLAENNNGRLLTKRQEYNKLIKLKPPSHISLKWWCGDPNHKPWYTSPSHIARGTWCPYCRDEKSKHSQIVYSFRKLKEMAQGRGGFLVTFKEEYDQIIFNNKPANANFTWWCGNKLHHPWQATPVNINRGTWCPDCSRGKYEKICRWYFEKIFQTPFPTVSLYDLFNINTLNPNLFDHYDEIFIQNMLKSSHFDGYGIVNISGKQFIVVMEYNGPQHYQYYELYHSSYDDYLDQKMRDEFKNFLAKLENIVFMEFPHYVDDLMNHPRKIQEYIVNEFERKTNISLKLEKQYDHCLEIYSDITDYF